jgi:hypothetical protein
VDSGVQTPFDAVERPRTRRHFSTMLASASTTSFTGARVVSKTTARRAKRAVAARAGQYDDELLETAVRDRRRERTRGADGGRMR